MAQKNKTIKLGVFGSRTLNDERVKILILEEMKNIGANIIVTSQEPLGVCTVAQNVAKFEHFVLELHFLNFKYLTGAYERRSDAIIDSADKVLLIHDGVSRGTANELKRVIKKQKPYRYEVLEIDDKGTAQDAKLNSFIPLSSDNADKEDVNFNMSNDDIGFF